MYAENVARVCIYKRVLFSFLKEENPAIWDNVDDPGVKLSEINQA
jgi:hypothetical protein